MDSGGVLVVLAIGFGLYFLPAIVAVARHHRQGLPIFILNLLLGWTVIGWVGALVWACINPSPPPTVIHQVIHSAAPPPASPSSQA